MDSKTTLPKLAHSIADAAKITSMSRTYIYERIKAGELKIFKIGARTLIHAEDLNAWIDGFRKAA